MSSFSYWLLVSKDSICCCVIVVSPISTFWKEKKAKQRHLEAVAVPYTKINQFWHPYLMNTNEMRSLWMEMKYIKSTAILLNRIWVIKGGLDLSKDVLWVSVGQRAADLRGVKVGGQQNILPISPRAGKAGSNRAARQNFLLTSNFDSP